VLAGGNASLRRFSDLKKKQGSKEMAISQDVKLGQAFKSTIRIG